MGPQIGDTPVPATAGRHTCAAGNTSTPPVWRGPHRLPGLKLRDEQGPLGRNLGRFHFPAFPSFQGLPGSLAPGAACVPWL